MNIKRFPKYIIIAILFLGIGFAIYHHAQSKDKIAYTTKQIKHGDLVQTVAANGTLNPVILVSVGTQVSGTVQKIYADFNDRVVANQVLLELDPKLFQASVQQSVAAVDKAKAALTLAIANEKRGRMLIKGAYIVGNIG